ncbi:hypothetical protein CXF59_03175 [Flavobacterium sp. ALD4]|nr:hypothetical protein CXF59_03175 [Flavobacterium sp. ALD4]
MESLTGNFKLVLRMYFSIFCFSFKKPFATNKRINEIKSVFSFTLQTLLLLMEDLFRKKASD